MPKTTKPNFNRIWAATALPSDVVDPGDTEFAEGWESEIPPYEFFNYLQQLFSSGLKYYNENGIAEWDSDTTYYNLGQCMINGEHFISLIDDNTGNDPNAGSNLGSKWRRGFVTEAQLTEKIQFAPWSPSTIYTLGDIVRGSDGKFYEVYKETGTVTGALSDPTEDANRVPIVFTKWIIWDGVKTGTVLDWPGASAPDGYTIFKEYITAPGWRLVAALPEHYVHQTSQFKLWPMLNTFTRSVDSPTLVGLGGGSDNHNHAASTGQGGQHNHGGHAHNHSLTIAQMPAHSHQWAFDDNSSSSGKGVDGAKPGSGRSTTSAGSGIAHNHGISYSGTHTHSVTTVQSSNVPKYRNFLKIIKM